jgi:hypothetical protein
MASSRLFRAMANEIRVLGRTYLNFSPRPAGDYTTRQMSAAAAYTMFSHAEFESYLEGWALEIVDFAETQRHAGKVTRPLAHLCTFHKGRAELTEIPPLDVWSEQFVLAIRQHRDIINKNHGIKEKNVCRLLAPIGFDLRRIDPVLIGDLDAFGTLRGNHAHQSHKMQRGIAFDPFDRKIKAESLVGALANLDNELLNYRSSF